MKKILIPLLILLIAVGISAATDSSMKQINLPDIPVRLEPGDGMDKTSVLCNICHSLDYITMQPKASKAQWTAAVNKMRNIFGAPISDKDAETIINYLAAHYGNGK